MSKNLSLMMLVIVMAMLNNVASEKGITTIDLCRTKLLDMELNLWNTLDNMDQINGLKQIFNEYRGFVDAHLSANATQADAGNGFIVLDQIFEWKVLDKDLTAVHNLFDAFALSLQKYYVNFDELALNDLTETILNDEYFPVAKTMEQIENIMVKQGLYYKAALEAKSQVCATRQSAQQVLFQLYTAITLTELKGYAMMQFSWMLLKSYGKGNFTRESQLMRNSFIERTAKTQVLLRNVMKRADRTVWRCDPAQHKEGETYVAVTRLLQGYIENEVDMNTDNTCRENCGAYQFAQSHGCYKDLYCAKQPKCSGKILHCQFIDSDMWICPAKSTSTRRYEYIEYENGRILGQKGSCTRGTTKVDSWWRWIFWHCSYCLCMCDEQGPKSDRYFNLREAVSNITANRVITGLRFRKLNQIIHVQIQEGELLPRGNINATTVQWKPLSAYKKIDRGVRDGIDYHTMAWDKRAIDLDDLVAPASHVVTGIRFRTLGAHLNLEIRITEVDFTNGKLMDPKTSYWFSNDNTETSTERRTQITLNRPDIPTKSPSKSVPTSAHNQYIEFTNTDLDSDLSQNTVPYLDAQDVTSMPPVALAGAGLYHKGQSYYGGFIAPKLYTYDFAPHIEVPEPVNKKK